MVTFFYSLFGKGLILSGRPGIFYALQRLIAEATLSLMILEEGFRERSRQGSEGTPGHEVSQKRRGRDAV
jgi:hypothetical protein